MAESGPSLLDTKETGVQGLDYPTYRYVRARSCAAELERSELLYESIDKSQGGSRILSLRKCRTFAWFVRDRETNLVHVASNSCRLRWCPLCCQSRKSFIVREVTAWSRQQKDLRFLTLTLKHSSEPLPAQIDRLYRSFRKLRRFKQFQRYCQGGVWFFQVKRSVDDSSWHPHLHCLIVGSYIPQIWLSQMWYHSSKCSKIVDIRKVYKPCKVSEYVARYAARPAKLTDYTEEQGLEIIESFHGRKLCGTWGTGKDCPLSPSKCELNLKYAFLGNWTTIHELSRTEPVALSILKCWSEHTPIDPAVSFADIDLFIDGQYSSPNVSVDKHEEHQSSFW